MSDPNRRNRFSKKIYWILLSLAMFAVVAAVSLFIWGSRPQITALPLSVQQGAQEDIPIVLPATAYLPEADTPSERSVLPVIYLEAPDFLSQLYKEGTMRIVDIPLTEDPNLAEDDKAEAPGASGGLESSGASEASSTSSENSPDALSGAYPGGSILYDGGIQIKLRGNSTMYRDKHPYKIKLDISTDLFGMGKNKHWVLLANDIDHSLIRNKITLDFALGIGMPYASESVFVNLFLNGEYQGVYQLAEQIRIGESRIDIYDWEDTFGSRFALRADEVETDVPQSGGFLLEEDFYSRADGSLAHIITAFQQPFYFNKPERIATGTELYQYAKNYVQSFEYALHSPDYTYHADGVHYTGKGIRFSGGAWNSEVTETEYTDETFDGFHYSELFDLDSLLENMLVCEVTMNWDCMKNSVFLYKDIDGPAYLGPVWDFDWAYGNVNMYNIDTYVTNRWHTTYDPFTREQYYQSVQWNRYLIRDPYYVMRLYEKYHEVRGGALQTLIDSIDVYEKYLAYDAALNDERWGYTYNGRYYSGGHPEDFAESIASLRSFVTARIAWLDAQFADYDTLLSSLGYYKSSDKISVELADPENAASEKEAAYVQIRIGEQAMCSEASAVDVQINGLYRTEARLSGSKEAAIAIPAEALRSGGNVIQVRPMDKDGAYYFPSKTPDSLPMSGLLVFGR